MVSRNYSPFPNDLVGAELARPKQAGGFPLRVKLRRTGKFAPIQNLIQGVVLWEKVNRYGIAKS